MKRKPKNRKSHNPSSSKGSGKSKSPPPGAMRYEVRTPENSPPAALHAHEFECLDLSRLPEGERLVVSDPWSDTMVTRKGGMLHTVNAIKVRATSESPEAQLLEKRMSFPDATDTADILKAVDECRAELRRQAERMGGSIEPAGESVGAELAQPIFPFPLELKPEKVTMTRDQFLACGLAALPERTEHQVEGDEPVLLNCARFGDQFIARFFHQQQMEAATIEYRGAVISVEKGEKGMTHTVVGRFVPPMPPEVLTSAMVITKLRSEYSLDTKAAEVCRTMDEQWQQALDYTKALLG